MEPISIPLDNESEQRQESTSTPLPWKTMAILVCVILSEPISLTICMMSDIRKPIY